MSLIDTFEEQHILEGLIQRFFRGIEEAGLLDELDEAESKQIHQDYATRISKVLLGTKQDDLDIDYSLLQMPINSDEPLFVAAEVFRDTMLEVGSVTEDVADLAKTAFYAIRKNK